MMRELPVSYTLPTACLREIGRIVTSYAFVEFQLSRTIYDVMGVGQKDGRVAVREGRASDRLGTIVDLMAIRGITKFAVDEKKLKGELTDCQSRRDEIAHGVWVYDAAAKRYFLRITRGKWETKKEHNWNPKRLINPEALEYRVEDLREIHAQILQASKSVYAFREDVVAQLQTVQRKPMVPGIPTPPP